MKELNREFVLTELLKEDVVRVGKATIRKVVEPSHLSGEPLTVFVVTTWDGEEVNFQDEDILEAVDCFINRIPKQVDMPDADMLRRVNYQVEEAEYHQWCEQKSSVLAKIAQDIYAANKDKQFKLEVTIEAVERANYYRYFKLLHYEVTMQTYGNPSRKDELLMTLDWRLITACRKQLRTDGTTLDEDIKPTFPNVPCGNSPKAPSSSAAINNPEVSEASHTRSMWPSGNYVKVVNSQEEAIAEIIKHLERGGDVR